MLATLASPPSVKAPWLIRSCRSVDAAAIGALSRRRDAARDWQVRCELREGVDYMNTGTEDGGGLTRVGDRCLFMVASHVGHDCDVGDDVTFANNAVLGGHVSIGSNTFVGGNAAVHQFARVGEGAMVGGLSWHIYHDLIPFGFGKGQIASPFAGLNVVGLRRRGTTRAEAVLGVGGAPTALLFLSAGVCCRSPQRFAVAVEFADESMVQRSLRSSALAASGL